jgi:predicted phage tail protein
MALRHAGQSEPVPRPDGPDQTAHIRRVLRTAAPIAIALAFVVILALTAAGVNSVIAGLAASLAAVGVVVWRFERA